LVSAETLRRNAETAETKIGANCNTGNLAFRLLAVHMEDKAVFMLAGIDDPKLDSAASHPSSSSHSLPHRVVCHPGHPAPMIMGGVVLWLHYASFTSAVVIRWSAVGFGYGYSRK